MCKRLLLLAIVLVLLFPALVTPAQEEPPAGCDLIALRDTLAAAENTLAEADLAAALDILRDLDNAISTARAACSDLIFTSDEYGMQPSLGPINLPDGIWRLTFKTEGYGALDETVLDGDCGEERLFSIFEGDATAGAQTIITTSGQCSMLITITYADVFWSLSFELIKPA